MRSKHSSASTASSCSRRRASTSTSGATTSWWDRSTRSGRMPPRLRKATCAALLFLLSGAYFYRSAFTTLEPMDEGHLLYYSWLVAEGAVPHRDFQHLYGP